jgi:hypothetical protein
MALFNIKEKDFSIIINEMEQDIEKVDPISFFKAYHIRSIIPTYIHIIEKLLGFCPKSWFKDIKTVAYEIAERQIVEAKEIALPPQLYDILERNLYKREQVRCLKGVDLSPLHYGAIFIQAGVRGYKFSNYCYKGIPRHFSEKELPSFIFLRDDGNLDIYGKTSLIDGQLKDYVRSSKFILARILDKGEHWHCFYQTKSGIQGKEPGKLGSYPHIHYISDAFGVSREDFIKALKGGKVPSSEVHILLSA